MENSNWFNNINNSNCISNINKINYINRVNLIILKMIALIIKKILILVFASNNKIMNFQIEEIKSKIYMIQIHN